MIRVVKHLGVLVTDIESGVIADLMRRYMISVEIYCHSKLTASAARGTELHKEALADMVRSRHGKRAAWRALLEALPKAVSAPTNEENHGQETVETVDIAQPRDV